MSDNLTPREPGTAPDRRDASAPRRRLFAAVSLLAAGALPVHAGDWGGTVAVSSQLVDRGVAVTRPGPIVQGAVNWVSRDGWSLGASASYQVRDPGRVAETLVQIAKSWSLSDDWQMQAGLLEYRYPGGGAWRPYDRTEVSTSAIWRDVLTASISAIKLAHGSGGPRGAADVAFRWPVAWHVSVTGGIGLAQYLAPLPQYYPYRPDRYSYGHGGLVWQEGGWRVELVHVFTNRERNRGEARVSPWTATVARTF